MSKVPYEHASTGTKARAEIIAMLRAFGCESVGFMDDFDRHEIILAFKHRGRPVQLKASAQGWAALWLKSNPPGPRRRSSDAERRQAALQQGLIAVNSVLRDWVKGQVTAIETGILSFEEVFVPFMLTADGTRVIDRITQTGLLPSPAEVA